MANTNVTSIRPFNLVELYKQLRLIDGAVRGLSYVSPHIPDHTGFELMLEFIEKSFYDQMVLLEAHLPDDSFTPFSPRVYDSRY